MGPEHKNLAMQTEQLNRLRDEIRGMDFDIMRDEAELGDAKRTLCKAWMALKFGGLQECCERGAEIPETTTQPGYPRPMYHGHQQVERHINDALRALANIQISTTIEGQPARNMSELLPPPAVGGHFLDSATPSAASSPTASYPPPSPFSPPAGGYRPPDGPPPGFPSAHLEHQDGPPRAVDDFGVRTGPQGPRESFQGPRYNTVPARGAGGDVPPMQPGGFLQGPPRLNTEDDSSSFAASVTEALNTAERKSSDLTRPGYMPPGAMAPYPPSGGGPGAANDQNLGNPWQDMPSGHQHTISSVSSNAGLAYMASDDEPDHKDHVKFDGATTDMDSGVRSSLHDPRTDAAPPVSNSPKRVPPPPLHPAEEEAMLNAVAAREVERELNALHFSPPPSDASVSLASDVPQLPPVAPLSTASPRAPPAPLRTSGDSNAPGSRRASMDKNAYSVAGRRASASLDAAPHSPVDAPPTYTPAQTYAHSQRESLSLSTDEVPRPTLTEEPIPASPRSMPSQTLPGSPRVTSPSPLASPAPAPMSPSPLASPLSSTSPLPRPSFPSEPGRPSSPLASFRTAPEFKRDLSSARSNSSLASAASGAPPTPGGARTISAAAFRRPRGPTVEGSGGQGGAVADTSPLHLKKRNPSATVAPPSSFGARSVSQGGDAPQIPPVSGGGEDEDFDYIGAYGDERPQSGHSRGGGYGEGRFATNLDNDGLR
ncbi:hypothetical protein GGG16DRAFT_88052 [Schizophyllum commune]